MFINEKQYVYIYFQMQFMSSNCRRKITKIIHSQIFSIFKNVHIYSLEVLHYQIP